MQKVLVADGSLEFSQALACQLEDKCTVAVYEPGDNLLQAVCKNSPDVLVMDLMLPGEDGLYILQKFADMQTRPVVLVLTMLANDFVMESLARLRVAYLMRKPCDAQVVAQRVFDIIRHYAIQSQKVQAEQALVAETLLKLGMPAKLRGSKYLQQAVYMLQADPAQLYTKELYPALGKIFEVDGKRVERCIRNAIHTTWSKCDESIWSQYFVTDNDGHVIRPTNAEFISRLSGIVLAEQQKRNMQD